MIPLIEVVPDISSFDDDLYALIALIVGAELTGSEELQRELFDAAQRKRDSLLQSYAATYEGMRTKPSH